MIFDLYDYDNKVGYIYIYSTKGKYYFDTYSVKDNKYKFDSVVKLSSAQVRAIHGQALIKIFGW